MDGLAGQVSRSAPGGQEKVNISVRDERDARKAKVKGFPKDWRKLPRAVML